MWPSTISRCPRPLSSTVFQWRVILFAALAVLLLLAGLVALLLPEPYEGPALYQLNEQHTVRVLDVVGVALIVVGCVLAWSAGVMWQRRMYDS